MKSIFFWGFVIAANLLVAQPNMRKIDSIRSYLKKESELRSERIERYSLQNNVPVIKNVGNSTIGIIDIDVKGNPVYVKTDNVGAAITTGAVTLQNGGDMGLSLDGAGVAIGIWDGGNVRESHQELVNRIIISDGGSSYNFHATHVAGTILATGVNSSSKGMATNAKAFTFDFFNDDTEMANRIKPDQSGLILSNHSYGLITGWDDGTWYGDSDISDVEDYRFGFYTGGARLWDDFAFNSPYYTIVKSAGNDRNDSGDGTHPQDGPYDIISSEATAKNIITIGAVNKVLNYQDASSVVMSSFSGWGPTDDGRIKPDFVAAGVGLLSTFETADDSYGSLSGTSMSAPNATGSFALLQQLYSKLHGGSFMKSAHLKGLITHTIKEAGISDGPDYKFGWGLVDVQEAAAFILKENDNNFIHKEIAISDNASFEMSFTPLPNTKVIATICWTDVPGNVPTASLDPTDLILVNDLDMRISSESKTELPWILNPEQPGAGASKGDNFRDNIEKIEFIADGSSLTLTINHKGEITGENQIAHLLISYEISDEPDLMYWTGNSSSEWSEPANWSLLSNGEPALNPPSDATTVIFDDVFEGETSLMLNDEVAVGSIVFLSSNQVSIDLNSHNIEIQGNYSSNGNFNFTGNGKVIFTGSDTDASKLISPSSSLSDVQVEFNNEFSTWRVQGNSEFGDINLINGDLELIDYSTTFKSLNASADGSKSLSLSNADVSIFGSVTLSDLDSFEEDLTIWTVPNSATATVYTDYDHSSLMVDDGELTIGGLGSFQKLENNGVVTLNTSFSIDTLTLSGNSTTSLEDEISLTIDHFEGIDNDAANRILIQAANSAEVHVNGHKKICSDFIDVLNVSKIGEAAISIGENGTVENGTGWSLQTCSNVLFADFDLNYLCDGSLTFFENKSSGDVLSYSWKVDGVEISNEENPTYQFPMIGVYLVELQITDIDGTIAYSQSFEVGEGIDKIHTIIENSTSLASSLSADSYQWFVDGEIIEGETSRTLIHNDEPGVYSAIAFIDNCNIVSNEYEIVVLGLEDLDQLEFFPNPLGNLFTIRGNDPGVSFEFISVNGKKLYPPVIESNQNGTKYDFSMIKAGVILLYARDGMSTKIYKLVIQK